MRITVHRGTHEIGGTCVELVSEGFHLLLDYGLPLVDGAGGEFILPAGASRESLLSEGILHDIPAVHGSYTGNAAVLISHAHPDHYGLLPFLDFQVPVYTSQGTVELMKATALFVPRAGEPQQLELIKAWEPVVIGPFRVTPYLVDHSAPDALAFLIEAENKTLFYTGDFRATGRKRKLFERLVAEPPGDVDLLLVEGTMFGREGETVRTEDELEEHLTGRLSQGDNLAFLLAAGQNLDRLVTAYHAALRSRRTLVIDLYVAWVLERLQVVSERIPQPGWKQIAVKYWRNHARTLIDAGHKRFLYKHRDSKVGLDEIAARPSGYLVHARDNTLLSVTAQRLADPTAVDIYWSMWQGYYTRDSRVREYVERYNIHVEHLHTSGHAEITHLRQLVEALSPKELLPVHTFHPGKFNAVHSNVIELQDGEVVKL